MRSVGYRQLWGHLEGHQGLAEAQALAVVATRQLARRQLTWLRAEPGAEWEEALDPGAAARIQERVERWLESRPQAGSLC
jgi:tRNA dimethylallyltransferase